MFARSEGSGKSAPEPLLLTDAISTKILSAYAVNEIFAVFKIQ